MAIPVSCEPVHRVGRSGASGAASGTDGTCPGEPPKATSSDRATDRCYADAGWESRSKPQDVGVCRHDDPLHVVNGAPPHPWGPHPPSGGCRPRLASGNPRRLAGYPPGRPQNRCSVSGILQRSDAARRQAVGAAAIGGRASHAIGQTSVERASGSARRPPSGRATRAVRCHRKAVDESVGRRHLVP